MNNIKLKSIMADYDLKPCDLAKVCGVSLDTVYVWLSSGQTNPISKSAYRILGLSCRLYDITGEWPE